MDSLLTRLTILLGDRYEVLREIGRGGMASVYLAQDRRHPRQVAIKVFRQDLAADVGHERFRREIAVAATLSHPNILALYDSGDSDGLLYYVMPYVAGESVGQRIAREGQLPIGESLAIARQVAAALQYAHTAGVVHRDIKPDNIMMSGDLALVTDFGIAHAVEQTGDQKLTAAGYAVGTPAYMSPEQCTGGTRIDGRSDIYSLGCVLYTMLIGQPPFGGPTAQATLARHLAEPVPGLRVVRSTIPPVVEAAVLRALAKSPADRFQSAAEFAEAISPEHLSDPIVATGVQPVPPARHWIPIAVIVPAMLLAVVVTRPWSLVRRSAPSALDQGRVAVLPFNVNGVADSAQRVAAAGVAALIVQSLPGDGGPRAIAVVSGNATSDGDALDLARRSGVGQFIRGSVSAQGGRLNITATLVSVSNDSILAHVDNVSGPPDSLVAVVNGLVARLLITGTRLSDTDRAALAGLPLPALRSYLAAYRAYLLGHSADAARLYNAVLQADSTCYPAALGLAAIPYAPHTRALELANAQRGRMDGNDSTFLRALDTPQDDFAGVAGTLRLFDQAANRDPMGSIKWYLLGEHLFHDGPALGSPDALRRAAASFEHALRLEPDFVPALAHGIDLAAARGDSTAVRALARRYFALDSVGVLPDFYHWRVAIALNDQPGLSAIRSRIPQFARPSLERIVNVAQFDGVGMADARVAANALWENSGASGEARWAFVKQRELALNSGRPAEATAILQRWRAATTVAFRSRDAYAEVVNALYWGADTAFPAQWVRQAAPTLAARAKGESTLGDSLYFDLCSVNLWRVAHGEIEGVAEAVEQLRKWRALKGNAPDALCAEIVDAQLAATTHAADAHLKLALLDSIAGTAPLALSWTLAAANLTAARLWEGAGDATRALAAVRRRPYITDIGEPRRVLVALSTMLREEGRLAAVAGDSSGAITAYRRYLALRDDAEPTMAGEVAGVRRELQRLEHRSSP